MPVSLASGPIPPVVLPAVVAPEGHLGSGRVFGQRAFPARAQLFCGTLFRGVARGTEKIRGRAPHAVFPRRALWAVVFFARSGAH